MANLVKCDCGEVFQVSRIKAHIRSSRKHGNPMIQNGKTIFKMTKEEINAMAERLIITNQIVDNTPAPEIRDLSNTFIGCHRGLFFDKRESKLLFFSLLEKKMDELGESKATLVFANDGRGINEQLKIKMFDPKEDSSALSLSKSERSQWGWQIEGHMKNSGNPYYVGYKVGAEKKVRFFNEAEYAVPPDK